MSLALLPVRKDKAKELFKVTKISLNCHLTFKNNTGILILQSWVYSDYKQHIYTWTVMKFSFPWLTEQHVRATKTIRPGAAMVARCFCDILPSGASPQLLWPQISERSRCPNREVVSFTHFTCASPHFSQLLHQAPWGNSVSGLFLIYKIDFVVSTSETAWKLNSTMHL